MRELKDAWRAYKPPKLFPPKLPKVYAADNIGDMMQSRRHVTDERLEARRDYIRSRLDDVRTRTRQQYPPQKVVSGAVGEAYKQFPVEDRALVYIPSVMHDPERDPGITRALRGLLRFVSYDMALSDGTGRIEAMPLDFWQSLFHPGLDRESVYPYRSVFDGKDAHLLQDADFKERHWDAWREARWQRPVLVLDNFDYGFTWYLTGKAPRHQYYLLDIFDLDSKGRRRGLPGMVEVPRSVPVLAPNPSVI